MPPCSSTRPRSAAIADGLAEVLADDAAARALGAEARRAGRRVHLGGDAPTATVAAYREVRRRDRRASASTCCGSCPARSAAPRPGRPGCSAAVLADPPPDIEVVGFATAAVRSTPTRGSPALRGRSRAPAAVGLVAAAAGSSPSRRGWPVAARAGRRRRPAPRRRHHPAGAGHARRCSRSTTSSPSPSPSTSRRRSGRYLRARLGPSARRARLVTAVSEFTAADVVARLESTRRRIGAHAAGGRSRPRAGGDRRRRRSSPRTGSTGRGSSTRRSPTPTRTTPCSSGPSPSSVHPRRRRPRAHRRRRPGRGASCGRWPSGSASPIASAGPGASPADAPRPSLPWRGGLRLPLAYGPSGCPCSRRWRARCPVVAADATGAARGRRRRRRPRRPRRLRRRGPRRCAGCSTTRRTARARVAAGPGARRGLGAGRVGGAARRGLARGGARAAGEPPRPLPPLRARRRPHRRGDDPDRRRARRRGATGSTSSRAALVPPHRVETGWRGRPWRTRTRRGAASPASTRSRPTRRTSRPGPSPSAGSPALAAASAAATPGAARRRAGDVAAAHPRARRVGGGPAPAGAVRVQHPGRVPRRRRRARRAHEPAGHRARRRGSSGSSYRAADAVTVLSDDLRDNVVAKLGRPAGGRGRQGPGDPQLRRHRAHPPRRPRQRLPARAGLTARRSCCTPATSGLARASTWSSRRRRGSPAATTSCSSSTAAARPGPSSSGRPAGLANVRFVDMQPKERLAEVLAAGDIHVVPLRRGLARSSVPSKLYSILAAGRPVLASVDEGTEVARTVERAGAGLAVPPEDPEAFAAALDAAARRPRGRHVGWGSGAAVRRGLGVAGGGGRRSTRRCSRSCGARGAPACLEAGGVPR